MRDDPRAAAPPAQRTISTILPRTCPRAARSCALRASASANVLSSATPTGGGSDAHFTSALGVPSLDGLGADGDGKFM